MFKVSNWQIYLEKVRKKRERQEKEFKRSCMATTNAAETLELGFGSCVCVRLWWALFTALIKSASFDRWNWKQVVVGPCYLAQFRNTHTHTPSSHTQAHTQRPKSINTGIGYLSSPYSSNKQGIAFSMLRAVSRIIKRPDVTTTEWNNPRKISQAEQMGHLFLKSIIHARTHYFLWSFVFFCEKRFERLENWLCWISLFFSM